MPALPNSPLYWGAAAISALLVSLSLYFASVAPTARTLTHQVTPALCAPTHHHHQHGDRACATASRHRHRPA